MKISDILLSKIDDILSHKPAADFDWHDSLYEKIQFISLDDKGEVGEAITYDILKNQGCDIEYAKSVTNATKGWDVKCNGIKIEVKLTTITIKGGGFQHENIEAQRDYDAILFIDVAPNELFVTVVKKQDINWTGKGKLHRRISGVYKCDFSIKHIKNNSITKFKHYKTGLVETEEDFYKIFRYLEIG